MIIPKETEITKKRAKFTSKMLGKEMKKKVK
jgi:hypothetical protein